MTSEEVPAARTARAPRRITADAVVFGVVVAALAVGGALLRIWILGHDAMNSDEAVIGLVARGILHGHQTAFVWHQAYGGVEPYLVAGMFAVFGSSAFTLNLVPSVLAAGVAVVTWRIGARLFSPRAGLAAAALAWVWPESGVFNSTREYGYHEAALLAGVVVLLLTVRIVQRRPAAGDPVIGWVLLDWALLGLVAGVGWWASPEIAYFLIPAVVALLGFCTRPPWANFALGVATAAACTVLGALAWIIAGIDDRWATISSVRDSRHSHTYDFRLHLVFSHALPFLYGLQVEGRGLWVGGASAGPVLYGLALAVTVAALVVVAVRHPAARLLVVFCVAFPFLYPAFPTSWFWQDGRYGVFLTPVLALVLMGAVSSIELTRPGAAAGRVRVALARSLTYVLLALAVASTWVAVVTTFQLSVPGHHTAPWTTDLSPSVIALGAHLERDGVHDAYADYWVAYDLQFLSGGGVTTFPIAQDKNPIVGRQVTRAARAAWIFVLPTAASQATADTQLGAGGDLEPPGVTQAPLVAYLVAHHDPYRIVVVGPFSAVIPARNVTPVEFNAPGTELGS
jgi:hypothetical protein